MMFRREGRSRSISQRASLGSFATGSLLGFVRKMAAADPESAVVVVARAGNPNAAGTVSPGLRDCQMPLVLDVLDSILGQYLMGPARECALEWCGAIK